MLGSGKAPDRSHRTHAHGQGLTIDLVAQPIGRCEMKRQAKLEAQVIACLGDARGLCSRGSVWVLPAGRRASSTAVKRSWRQLGCSMIATSARYKPPDSLPQYASIASTGSWSRSLAHPPSGRARWTMELLAGEMVRLTSHETLSGDTVGRRLAEMDRIDPKLTVFRSTCSHAGLTGQPLDRGARHR